MHNKYTSTLLPDDDILLQGSDVPILKVWCSADCMMVADEEGRQEWGESLSLPGEGSIKERGLMAVLPPTSGDTSMSANISASANPTLSNQG